MAIDRADWHWDDTLKLYREMYDVEGDLDEEQENVVWLLACNHIGMFLHWIIENGFEGAEADPVRCEDVRRGRISGSEYLMWDCDGKFWEDDVRHDILPFVNSYYGDRYIADYEECCADGRPMYTYISGADEYFELRERIDAAFEQFFAEGGDLG